MNGQTRRQELDHLPRFKAPARSVVGPGWLRYLRLRRPNRRQLVVAR